MKLVVKGIIVIYRKNETILILVSLKRYFSHPDQSILKSSLTLRRHCNSGPWPFSILDNFMKLMLSKFQIMTFPLYSEDVYVKLLELYLNK